MSKAASSQPRGFLAVLGISIWGLLLFSWASSAYGIYTIAASSAAMLISAAIGLGASGVIQTLLGGFWMNALGSGLRLHVRGVLMVLGIVVSLISAGLAAAFYTDVLGLSADYQRLLNTRRYETIAAPAGRYADDMERVATAFSAVAGVSADKKASEFKDGGSCDAPKSRNGEGPIKRMRGRVSEEAAARGLEARAQADQARTASRLPDVIDNEALFSAYGDVRSLSLNGRTERLRSWATDLAANFESGFVDPSSGTRFMCTDAALLKSLRLALGALDATMDLPTTPPSSVTVTIKEAAGNSFGTIFTYLHSLIDSSVQIDEEAFAATKPAFIAALAVEAAIIVLILIRNMVSPAPAGGGARPRGTLDRPQGKRLTEPPARVLPAVELLEAMIQVDGDEHLLFVPRDGEPAAAETRARLLAEVARWNMRQLRIGAGIDMATHLPKRHALLAPHAPGACKFSVFVAPPAMLRWLADARLALQQAGEAPA